MASMFNTTARVYHVTPFPKGTSEADAISLLQGKGNEIILQCDPHMIRYKTIDTPSPEPTIPSDREIVGKAIAPPRCYSVTDRVQALPAGIWDSDVESTCEFIDIERGVFVRLRSPLSVVMETVWQVREKGNDDGSEDQQAEGEYELVEEIIIKCSRLLIGVVKNTSEAGWRQVHEKMMERVKKLNADGIDHTEGAGQ